MFAVSTDPEHARKPASTPPPDRFKASNYPHDFLKTLFTYGASIPAQLRRSAELVDRVLRGARPADIPVEQPTKFELVVNLRAAKALGIVIPQSVVLRADELIQ